MTNIRYKQVCAQRYDGSLPDDATVPYDYDQPRAVQLWNRRITAWSAVRRTGKASILVRRHCRKHPTPANIRDYSIRRRDVRHALKGWIVYKRMTDGICGRLVNQD